MKELTLLFSVVTLCWGAYGCFKGKIWVGSRSYSGGTSLISKDESPIRFYFWCGLYIGTGILGLYAYSNHF